MGNVCCAPAKREHDHAGDLIVNMKEYASNPELKWEKQFPMCKIHVTRFHELLNKSGKAKLDINLSELGNFFTTPVW